MGINISLSRDVPSSLSLLLFASLPGHVRVDDGDDEVRLDQIVVTSTRTPALIRDEPLRAEALPDDADARRIDRRHATPWPGKSDRGDTVWFGVIDRAGRAVSCIQSLYFEFGSGIVLPQTGVLWQNRGCSFALDGFGVNVLAPGRKPFHTLNPAMARLADGRTMVYGAMGGEGQPQTQAAVFTRYALFGQSLQASVTAPRWVLGRTWGEETTQLRIENRFDPAVIEALEDAGHPVQSVEPFTATMGHAGAVVRTADSIFEAACDPRSDGAALGW